MKRRRIILLTLCMTLLCIGNWQVFSQSNIPPRSQVESQLPSERRIVQFVQGVKDKGESFPAVDLFERQAPSVSRRLKSQAAEDETIQRAVNNSTVLKFDRSMAQSLIESDLESITLPLPTENAGTVELELVKAEIYSPDFTVVTSSGEEPVEYEKGVHYWGVVKGDPNSLAAISIFRNEVMGFYSTEEGGNVVLGRLRGNNRRNRHVLYAERDLKSKRGSVCGTKDDEEILPVSTFQPQAVPVANKRLKIYVEADFDVYQSQGSVANTVNFITGIFNQSAVLFSSEGIPIVLSQVFVWTSQSPYNSQTSQQVLTQFQNTRTSFNGDFGHLVSVTTNSNLGGIAAGFNGFCNASYAQRECFSDVDTTYSAVPTYSWTVGVFTHEMGHLMGSRHTHACVWNGNGTAIDGCGPTANPIYAEGSCQTGPIPGGGGTIMSYCHLLSGVGINFANGFGPQPGNVIRSQFSSAGCLATGVPLYRFYSPSVTDHYYTINRNDAAAGWNFEKVECIVFKQQLSGTVPLYRYWNPNVWGDHFYTTNFNELGNGAQGWSLEGVECYIYSQQQFGTVPLYRYWNSTIGDHFYTTTFHELGNGAPGYVYEKIEGYVLPNP
jgi:Metallo-peptidase family M12/Repeat of unknown function (DUF5648)